jgi:hypothetical protein
MALILRHEARDFHNGKKITASMIVEDKIDDHHVFPVKHLADILKEVPSTLRDCVLNRTLIDKKTNIRISKRAPSDYLEEIAKTMQADGKFEKLLRSHLLPASPDSSLRKDDFEQFLADRQKLVAQQIVEVTA